MNESIQRDTEIVRLVTDAFKQIAKIHDRIGDVWEYIGKINERLAELEKQVARGAGA